MSTVLVRRAHYGAKKRGVAVATALICAGASAATGVVAGETARADGVGVGTSVTKAVVDFDGVATGGTVTLDESTNLRNQIVRISYTGLNPSIMVNEYVDPLPTDSNGDPTGPPAPNYDGFGTRRVVTVMQCWGGANPDREHCLTLNRSNSRAAVTAPSDNDYVDPDGNAISTYFYDSEETDPTYEVGDPRVTHKEQRSDIPFVARNGQIYNEASFPDISQNSDSTRVGLINEDGTGTVDFEVRTGVEAPSLACNTQHPDCSIVVVPEDMWLKNWSPVADYQAPGAESTRWLLASASARGGAAFLASNWKRKIVFPLTFAPNVAACPQHGAQIDTHINELSTEMIQRWQPALCNAATPVNLSSTVLSDGEAAGSFRSGASSISLVQRPASSVPPARAAAFAPVGVEGIGFSWIDDTAPPGFELRLTPRLVAKLLTESYSTRADPNTPTAVNSMGLDPDFLALNSVALPDGSTYLPGFAYSPKPILASSHSDAVRQLWDWILADPDAYAWLQGVPDPWGMSINALWRGYQGDDYFATRDNWSCRMVDNCQLTILGTDPTQIGEGKEDSVLSQGGYHLRTSSPSNTLLDAAQLSVRGQRRDTTLYDFYDKPPRWRRNSSLDRAFGGRAELSFMDTATASRFRLRMAALQNASGQFVTPDSAGLSHAANGAVQDQPTGAWSVLPSIADPQAYPMTAVTHAEVATAGLDTQVAAGVGSFLRHAAGPGQQVGSEAGALPGGYTPTTQEMKDQTLALAKRVETQAGVISSPTPTGVATSSPSPTGSATAGSAPSSASASATQATRSPAASTPAAATVQAPGKIGPEASPTSTLAAPTPTTTPGKASPTGTPKPSKSSHSTPTASGKASTSPRRPAGGGASTVAGAKPPAALNPSGSAIPSVPATSATDDPTAVAGSDPSGAPFAAPGLVTVATQAEAAGPMRWALLLLLASGLAAMVAVPALKSGALAVLARGLNARARR